MGSVQVFNCKGGSRLKKGLKTLWIIGRLFACMEILFWLCVIINRKYGGKRNE